MTTASTGTVAVGGGGQGGAGGQGDEVDVIIDKLLTVRGARPGKPVQLLEAEIKMLCTRCVACVIEPGQGAVGDGMGWARSVGGRTDDSLTMHAATHDDDMQGEGHLHAAVDAPGAGGAHQDLRGHPRAVLRPAAPL